MSVVILCGGRGTRIYPETAEIPKPLIQIGHQPLLRHVMDVYASQGCQRFVLAAGYLAERIRDFASRLPPEWEVEISDAGADAPTGERVLACREQVSDPFFVTYGDGLADVDIAALADFHFAHAGCSTITSVPLRSQYGTIEAGDGGRVARFREKPVLEGHWINGGFLVFDIRAFSAWRGHDLEREVLPHLAEISELYAYRHRGFWKSLDTYKDALEISELACHPPVPWLPSPPDHSPTRVS